MNNPCHHKNSPFRCTFVWVLLAMVAIMSGTTLGMCSFRKLSPSAYSSQVHDSHSPPANEPVWLLMNAETGTTYRVILDRQISPLEKELVNFVQLASACEYSGGTTILRSLMDEDLYRSISVGLPPPSFYATSRSVFKDAHVNHAGENNNGYQNLDLAIARYFSSTVRRPTHFVDLVSRFVRMRHEFSLCGADASNVDCEYGMERFHYDDSYEDALSTPSSHLKVVHHRDTLLHDANSPGHTTENMCHIEFFSLDGSKNSRISSNRVYWTISLFDPHGRKQQQQQRYYVDIPKPKEPEQQDDHPSSNNSSSDGNVALYFQDLYDPVAIVEFFQVKLPSMISSWWAALSGNWYHYGGSGRYYHSATSMDRLEHFLQPVFVTELCQELYRYHETRTHSTQDQRSPFVRIPFTSSQRGTLDIVPSTTHSPPSSLDDHGDLVLPFYTCCVRV